MPQRDKNGKFAPGNTICYAGWQGLVTSRFNGDLGIAQEYVRQLGRYSYGKMCDCELNSPAMVWRKYNIFFHPGTPEAFTQQYNQRFEFSLEDVPELNFVN